MRDAVALSLLFAACTALGLFAVRSVGIPLDRRWGPTAAGLAPLVGLLLVGCVGMVVAAAGLPTRVPVVLPLAAVAVGVAFLARRGRVATLWHRRADHASPWLAALELILLAVLGALLLVSARLFLAMPLRTWDGWAIWGLHAKAIYHDGDATGPVFTDPAYASGHPEYPILQPVLEALSAGAVGRFDPFLVHAVPAFLLAAIALALWGVLRTVVPAWLAAGAVLALVGVETLRGNIADNYADGSVAAIVALGALLLLLWVLWRSSAALVLAAFFLACAGLVKSEGMAFAAAAVVAAGLASPRGRRDVAQLLVVGAVALVPPLAWLGLQRARGVRQESYELSVAFDRVGARRIVERAERATGKLLDELLLGWGGSITLIVLAVALALLARRYRGAVFATTWLGLVLLVLVASYVQSTIDVTWHLATSAARVVTTIGVGMAVLAPVIAVDAWDALTGRPGPDAAPDGA